MKKKIMFVFGTRPEAIKMCPLVNELKSRDFFEVIVCTTGQHKEMLQQVLEVFQVEPDYSLSVMKTGQNLLELSAEILKGMQSILNEVKPDLVLVHGDTSTTFNAALACFYMQIPVGHLEAGLRTYNIRAPYPEEFNRQAVGIIADYHFAPTTVSMENLIREGKHIDTVYVTGNTAIDALNTTITPHYTHPLFTWIGTSRLILITAHRRENLGEPMRNMFRAINRVCREFSDIKVIYPIHMNPAVRNIAAEVLGNNSMVKIIEPMNVIDFHNFMNRSYLILTDSGGIQEEAAHLGKPVLVMREITERPEGVAAGTLKLTGTGESSIYQNFKQLLTDEEQYKKMSNASNPYGDGYASKRIADILENKLASS